MIERAIPKLKSSPSETTPVRGRPFQQGNPGRPPGSKNKLARLLEQLVENEGETLVRKQIELAKDGNVRCLGPLVDRLVPKRPGRRLDLQLPTINGVHDIAAVGAAIMNELNNGNLTPEEASHLLGLVETYTRVVTTSDLAMRLEKVELQVEQMKKLKGREDLIR